MKNKKCSAILLYGDFMKKYDSCLFLYNPMSGKEDIVNKLDYIVNRLSEKFNRVDVHPSTSKEDFIETAKKACGVYDYLVFSGGDGSYNLVINGVAEMENQPILGYIPRGTCNDIASNMRLPTKNLKKCLDIIINNDYIEHDVFKINDTFCMYSASLGDLAELSYSTPHNVKKIWGRIAYYFSGARQVLKKPNTYKVDLEVDGIPFSYETPLVLVLNSKSAAGIKFNQNGYLNDGKLDIMIVKGKYLRGLRNMIRLFIRGILKIKTESVSYLFRSNKFSMHCLDDSKYWSYDGEMGSNGKLDFEVYPKCIKVISNAK